MKQKNKIILLAASVLGMAASSNAAIVVAGGNGNFESTDVSDMTFFGGADQIYTGGSTSLEGWTFSGPGTTFRWLFNNLTGYGPVIGTYALNLTGVNGAFYDVVSTTVSGLSFAQTYNLSFYTAVRSGAIGSYVVKVDGTTLDTITTSVGTSYVPKSYSFTAVGPTATLSFEYAATTGGNGFMLDNVTVVPEPSAAALAGLAGLGLAMRRRRA